MLEPVRMPDLDQQQIGGLDLVCAGREPEFERLQRGATIAQGAIVGHRVAASASNHSQSIGRRLWFDTRPVRPKMLFRGAEVRAARGRSPPYNSLGIQNSVK